MIGVTLVDNPNNVSMFAELLLYNVLDVWYLKLSFKISKSNVSGGILFENINTSLLSTGIDPNPLGPVVAL